MEEMKRLTKKLGIPYIPKPKDLPELKDSKSPKYNSLKYPYDTSKSKKGKDKGKGYKERITARSTTIRKVIKDKKDKVKKEKALEKIRKKHSVKPKSNLKPKSSLSSLLTKAKNFFTKKTNIK